MSILTPEAQVMCDAALEAGIAPPTHEDPVVCEKQLYYLALSVGTPVHDLIRRLVFNENIYVLTKLACENLFKRACVYVAICAAKSVLGLIPENEERPKRAIDAACKWLKDPSANAAYAAADSAAYAAYAAAYAADAAAANYAAAAAAAAANYAAAYAADSAAYAAYAAAYAADSAAYAAANAAAYAAADAAANADAAASKTLDGHWARTIDFHALVLESAIFAAKEYP